MIPQDIERELDAIDPLIKSDHRRHSVRGMAWPKRCPTCNRFLRKDGTCIKVFWDDYAGAWEHG